MMNLHDSTIRKNIRCNVFPDFCSVPVLALILDELGHQVGIHFGTPLVSNSMFFDDFGDRIFINFDPKLFPQARDADARFH